MILTVMSETDHLCQLLPSRLQAKCKFDLTLKLHLDSETHDEPVRL